VTHVAIADREAFYQLLAETEDNLIGLAAAEQQRLERLPELSGFRKWWAGTGSKDALLRDVTDMLAWRLVRIATLRHMNDLGPVSLSENDVEQLARWRRWTEWVG
jgi:hypothetical protein